MDVVAIPQVILVYFELQCEGDFYADKFRGKGCLVHACQVPRPPPPSFIDRILRRKNPLGPVVKAAYDFVVKNYRTGDNVIILDSMDTAGLRFYRVVQINRHNTIRQLSAALHAGFLGKSKPDLVRESIPVKCVYFHFHQEDRLGWSGVDRVLSELPPSVENLICFDKHEVGGHGAYAVERGSHGRIKRKECWHILKDNFGLAAWIELQTSHIMLYGLHSWVYDRYELKRLVSTATYSNCTRRRGGLPSDGAIPTGGQLIRVVEVAETSLVRSFSHLVWSARSYVEGEYDDVCGTPIFGPKPLQ